MAAHLARHTSSAHKAEKPNVAKPKRGRKPAKKAAKIATPAAPAKSAAPVRRRQTPAAPVTVVTSDGVDVRAMTVDQLLSLKSAVDARLADIVKKMRAAKVAL